MSSEPDPRLDAEELKLWDEWAQRASAMECGNAPDWAVKYADRMLLERRKRMKPSAPVSMPDVLEALAIRFDEAAENARRRVDAIPSGSVDWMHFDGQVMAWNAAAKMIREAKL